MTPPCALACARSPKPAPRWDYRRAHGHLLTEGWSVNKKRVQRIWREEGLRVPAKAKKRRRLGESTTAADRLKAEYPNHVWGSTSSTTPPTTAAS